jgi:hypothetical protein
MSDELHQRLAVAAPGVGGWFRSHATAARIDRIMAVELEQPARDLIERLIHELDTMMVNAGMSDDEAATLAEAVAQSLLEAWRIANRAREPQ